MSGLVKSSRARGSTRGGCGGGYEQTSETYDADKLRKLRGEYDRLWPRWRKAFLKGLSRYEQAVVTDRRIEIR